MGPIQVERQRFTVDDYHKMAEVGILSPDDRVELIDGEILRMSPIGSRHADCVNRLLAIVYDQVHRDAIVSIQNPIILNDGYEPDPDVAVLRRRNQSYADHHPSPEDVFLVIEVSDLSLEFDLAKKIPEYGRSGVSEAWVIDLHGDSIQRHSDAFDEGYRVRSILVRDESLSSTVLPSLEIIANEILGARPPSFSENGGRP